MKSLEILCAEYIIKYNLDYEDFPKDTRLFIRDFERFNKKGYLKFLINKKNTYYPFEFYYNLYHKNEKPLYDLFCKACSEKNIEIVKFLLSKSDFKIFLTHPSYDILKNKKILKLVINKNSVISVKYDTIEPLVINNKRKSIDYLFKHYTHLREDIIEAMIWCDSEMYKDYYQFDTKVDEHLSIAINNYCFKILMYIFELAQKDIKFITKTLEKSIIKYGYSDKTPVIEFIENMFNKYKFDEQNLIIIYQALLEKNYEIDKFIDSLFKYINKDLIFSFAICNKNYKIINRLIDEGYKLSNSSFGFQTK